MRSFAGWVNSYQGRDRQNQFGYFGTNRPSEDVQRPTIGTGRAEVEDTITKIMKEAAAT
jgi:hypothetical protein